ncbi:MAG: hypothetical protein ABI886_16205, partial [Betaproteobacteria bacterium]
MNIRFGFIACLALNALCIHTALAQTEYLRPMLSISPQIPTSLDPVHFKIDGITGVGALVDSSSITLQGTTIEIDATITLGNTNVGLSYTIRKDLAALPE